MRANPEPNNGVGIFHNTQRTPPDTRPYRIDRHGSINFLELKTGVARVQLPEPVVFSGRLLDALWQVAEAF